MYDTETLEDRAQSIAKLTIHTARMNSDPADVAPICGAIERILEIASCAPGGWNSVIDGLRVCETRNDVLAFCRAFTATLSVENHVDGSSASFDPPQPF